jgi:hypothetical protein
MAATAGHRLTLDPMGKKQKLDKGHSNDHSPTVWVQSVHYIQRRRSLKFQPIRAYYWPWQPSWISDKVMVFGMVFLQPAQVKHLFDLMIDF